MSCNHSVLALLRSFVGTGVAPNIFVVHHLGIQYVVDLVLWMDKVCEIGLFSLKMIEPMMMRDEHNLFWRFTKMNPRWLYVSKSEDDNEFNNKRIIYYSDLNTPS